MRLISIYNRAEMQLSLVTFCGNLIVARSPLTLLINSSYYCAKDIYIHQQEVFTLEEVISIYF